MSSLPPAARKILNEGDLCYLAAPSAAGPHVTPVVFVLDGGRVWGTTGRGTTKAKLWRGQPLAGGLVGHGDRWLAFRGPVTLYDALDPLTWPSSLRRGPRVASASIRFSLKNARFFAGYARDVTRIPLAWTPPGRVIFSIDLAAGAVLGESDVHERWGEWGERLEGVKTFRHSAHELGLEGLPAELRELLLTPGRGVLARADGRGPVVLPAGWIPSGGSFFARLPTSHLSLCGGEDTGRASLVVDRASAWRAAKMRGVLVRGASSVYLPDELRRGRGDLKESVGELPEEEAVVRVRPRSIVWWSGWTSGTVKRP